MADAGYKMKCGKIRDNAGFLLLEVMVALSVLSVGILTAMHTFSLALEVNQIAQAMERAYFLAQQKMVEIAGRKELLEGTTSGDFGQKDPHFSWQVALSPVLFGNSEMVRVKVTVFWTRKGGRRNVSLVTLLPDETFTVSR